MPGLCEWAQARRPFEGMPMTEDAPPEPINQKIIDFDPPKVVADSLRVYHGILPSDRIYHLFGPNGEALLASFSAHSDYVIITPPLALSNERSVLELAKVVILW
jgi:hypothetical protein